MSADERAAWRTKAYEIQKRINRHKQGLGGAPWS